MMLEFNDEWNIVQYGQSAFTSQKREKFETLIETLEFRHVI